MSSFNVNIASRNGISFSAQAKKVIARTINGDVCILERHADYVSPLSEGHIKIAFENGSTKTAFCSGGFISVRNGAVNIAPSELEWTSPE